MADEKAVSMAQSFIREVRNLLAPLVAILPMTTCGARC
jgi:hypothetical protein